MDMWRHDTYCVGCSYHGCVGRDDTKEEAIQTVEALMCRNADHQKHRDYRAQVQNLETDEVITWLQFEPDLFSLLEAM